MVIAEHVQEKILEASDGHYLILLIWFIDFGAQQYTPCRRKKQATLIFTITSPSVEIFLQFLKHFVQE